MGNSLLVVRGINHKYIVVVKENGAGQLYKYVSLVVVSGTISALIVSHFKRTIYVNLIIIKAIVEICLFFVNYYIQKSFIFVKHKDDKTEISVRTDAITKKQTGQNIKEEKPVFNNYSEMHLIEYPFCYLRQF